MANRPQLAKTRVCPLCPAHTHTHLSRLTVEKGAWQDIGGRGQRAEGRARG